MFSEEFKENIIHGREEVNIEYKDSMSWNDRMTKLWTIRAILALANSPGKGFLIFGVKQEGEEFIPRGMQDAHYRSFKHDSISKKLRSYADPCPEIKVHSHELDLIEGDKKKMNKFIIITVEESNILPVICLKTERKNRDNPSFLKNIELRKSAVYIRRGTPVESAEIVDSHEWRELIDKIASNYARDLFKKMPCKYFKGTIMPKVSGKTKFKAELKGDGYE